MQFAEQTYHASDHYPDSANKVVFGPLFVNSKEFVELKNYAAIKVCWAENAKQEVIGRIVFANTGNEWVSLPGSPFGGLECTGELDEEGFMAFVVRSFDRTENVRLINGPSFYGSRTINWAQLGFRRQKFEINHHIVLGKELQISKMQQRRYRKCSRAGFKFDVIGDSIEELIHLHGFIAYCRQEKGLSINISIGEFISFNQTFPKNYIRFGVWDGHNLIAATVLVVMNKSIVYNYLPASTKDYNIYSPMVFLLVKIDLFLKHSRFDYFDLGVSSINGELQQGLSYFKETMGAERTIKEYFIMESQEYENLGD